MTTYVNDNGTWREINNLYVHDGTSFTNKTIDNAYINDSGTWREVFTLFTTTAYSTTTGNIAVPAGANAIHVQYAVGGGGGSMNGLGYDKGGGEQGGRGGGSGGWISDKVFSITGGETLAIATGTGGSAGSNSGFNFNASAGDGGNTSIVGGITGTLFTLGGGGGSSYSGGYVQGPLATQTSGAAGTASISTSLSTGTTTDGINITTLNSGPDGAFNQGGAGAEGNPSGGASTAPNCGGDNCNIGGADGANSYNENISGGSGGGSGAGGSAGTRGSGAGGGGKEAGGNSGGAGEINYRFMRIT